ncbi:MAG: hypothetical protein RSD74_02195 [Angelakisella sp.]
MSATAIFLQVQYQLGKVTEAQIRALVGSKLTQSEADEILAVK